MMPKLWDKGYTVNAAVERFTVGSDWELDRRLVASDCTASAAHAEMLASIGILTLDERDRLKQGLSDIAEQAAAGTFLLTREHEDCHTAIELQLTEVCGEAGKKIHTGRSRNDQVQTALRLWMRGYLYHTAAAAGSMVYEIADFAARHADIPMPGRTHMQIAMPSSIGLWAGAYAEELEDGIGQLLGVIDLIDQCPLGSAASYGVPLPLNREMTAELLGFSRVQNNVLYANNSRGLYEAAVVDRVDSLTLTLSRAAQDLILYSMPEFGYFSLPRELCTGSSIMPQKKNPDVLELVRSRSALVSASGAQIKGILRALPSGYNRDLQDTKGPFMAAALAALQTIEIMRICFESLVIHPERLRSGFIPEIYATDAAIAAVLKGESFRDAYRSIGTNLEGVAAGDPDAAIMARKSTGTTGNLNLERVRSLNRQHVAAVERMKSAAEAAIEKLMGKPTACFVP